LVGELHQAVVELNDNSFIVKRHLRYVELFRNLSSWNNLETIEISNIKEHISPIIKLKRDDELAKRFDYLLYSVELGFLQSKNVQAPVNIVVQTAELLSHKYTIPQVDAQRTVIERVQTKKFWDDVSILELDTVRLAMRGLLQYLDKIRRKIYYTDFTDTIVDVTEGVPLYDSNDLKNYRKKVEFYLKEHSNNLSVYKLRNNKRLSESDLKSLEKLLWEELGSKTDYEKEYGDTPIGRLVRRIVGVDRNAVNEAFSEFLTEERLNINQIRFVNLIVDYIVANGNVDDNRVLMEEPFRSVGSITTLFKDDMGTAKRIMDVVADIKRNSEEIA
jgi:type I restriction enzyme R subunit